MEAEQALDPMKYPRELAHLEARQGTAWTAATCRSMLREILSTTSGEETLLAVSRHVVGSRLKELLAHRAPQVLGRRTLEEFFEFDCGLDFRRACEIILYADGATEDEGKFYGYSRTLVGVELARRLKVKLADLAQHELTVQGRDGTVEKIRFGKGTLVTKLRRALAQLPDEAEDEPAPVPRDAARRYRAMEQVVAEHELRSEVVARLKVRVTLYRRRARVRNDGMTTREEFLAMSRLCADLAKLG